MAGCVTLGLTHPGSSTSCGSRDRRPARTGRWRFASGPLWPTARDRPYAEWGPTSTADPPFAPLTRPSSCGRGRPPPPPTTTRAMAIARDHRGGAGAAGLGEVDRPAVPVPPTDAGLGCADGLRRRRPWLPCGLAVEDALEPLVEAVRTLDREVVCLVLLQRDRHRLRRTGRDGVLVPSSSKVNASSPLLAAVMSTPPLAQFFSADSAGIAPFFAQFAGGGRGDRGLAGARPGSASGCGSRRRRPGRPARSSTPARVSDGRAVGGVLGHVEEQLAAVDGGGDGLAVLVDDLDPARRPRRRAASRVTLSALVRTVTGPSRSPAWPETAAGPGSATPSARRGSGRCFSR